MLYILTLAKGAYPDVSSYYITQGSGIEPRLAPGGLLFYLVSRLVSLGASSSLSLRLNLFGAINASLAVWLVYQITSLFIYASSARNPVNRKHILIASIAAGVVASLSLAFIEPFWSISNRFHVGSFHVMMFLALTRFFMLAVDSEKWTKMLVFAFLYGLGCTEYCAFIPFSIMFGLFILFWLWVTEEINPKIIIQLIACALAGLLFIFVSGFVFYKGQVYQYMDDMNYWHVLWFLIRDHYLMLSKVLPESGWLIILAVTTVPWLVCLFLARRGLNEDPNPSLFLLHAAITVPVVVTVFNLPFVKEPLAESYIHLVMPYVLTCMSFGYLAAYWFLVPSAISGTSESKFLLFLRSKLGFVLIIPFLGAVLVLPVLNMNAANGRVSAFLDSYCEEVLSCVEDDSLLVVGRTLENNFLVKAHEMKKQVVILNLSRARNDVYLTHISEQLGDSESKAYADIDTLSLLKAWLDSEPENYKKLAILDVPDLWRSLGYEPVPNKLVFRGEKSVENAKLIYDEHASFWELQQEFLETDVASNEGMKYLFDSCKRHMSLVANNLGLMLQDSGNDDLACNSYLTALKICPDNISAMLNLSVMNDRGYQVPGIKDIVENIKSVSEDKTKRKGIWVLSRMYGYVRHPNALARKGISWALSGRPDMALQELKQAEKLIPEEQRGGLQTLIASLYMRSGNVEQGEEVYGRILESDPDNRTALIGLARLYIDKSEFNEAQAILKTAEERGVEADILQPEYAMLALKLGDLGKARIIIEDVLHEMNDKVTGLLILAEVLKQQGEEEELMSRIAQLEQIPHGRVHAFIIKGERAIDDRDVKSALANYESALELKPGNLTIREKLLRLYFASGKQTDAINMARDILSVSADNPFANYVMGTWRIHKRDYESAETFLRRSVREREAPESLNDLAFVLLNQGDTKESEEYARKAIALNKEFFVAWDTLGEIQLAKGLNEDAKQSFERAYQLNRSDPRILLHLAEVYLLLGDRQQASNMLDEVFPRMKLMPQEEQKRLVDLRARARY
ncbi:hypothetical protein BVX97_05270 [bacterium E08(2017)]|nr:hypothetical protein BVX97_05270 [bacterium E08(2017)]